MVKTAKLRPWTKDDVQTLKTLAGDGTKTRVRKEEHDARGRRRADMVEWLSMTEMLEEAIAKIRTLPAADQDTVAVAVLSMAEEKPVALDPETRAAIGEGLEQAGRGEFVPDEEIDELWKRHGV